MRLVTSSSAGGISPRALLVLLLLSVAAALVPTFALAGDVGAPTCQVTGGSGHWRTTITVSVNCGPDATLSAPSGALAGVVTPRENNTGYDYTYTPSVDFQPADSFTFTASRPYDDDGEPLTDPVIATTDPIEVPITIENAKPVCSPLSFSVAHAGPDQTEAFELACPDPDAEDAGQVIYEQVVTDPYTPAYGAFESIDWLTGAGTFTANNSAFVGTDHFSFRAHDGAEYSATKIADIAFTNAAPTCENAYSLAAPLEVRHGTQAAGAVTCSDPEGDTVTITPSTAGRGVAKDFDASGNFNYAADLDEFGPDSFTFTAKDPFDATSASKTAFVKVTNPNTPVCQALGYTPQVHAKTALDIYVSCSDDDFETVTTRVGTQGSKGNAVAVANEPGHFIYTPNANVINDTDAFTVIANDGQADSAPRTISVAISNAKAECYANDFFNTLQNVRFGKNAVVRFSCYDNDNDTLATPIATQPTSGTVSLVTTDGAPGSQSYQLTYSPPADTTLTQDSFSISVSDGIETGTPLNLTVNLTKNHRPSCFNYGVEHFRSTEAGTPQSIALNCSDVDYQDKTLTYTAGSLTPAVGTLGTAQQPVGLDPAFVNYTPSLAAMPYATQFSVSATDGALASAVSIQRIHVSDKAFCAPLPTLQLRVGQTKAYTPECTDATGGSVNGLSIVTQPGGGLNVTTGSLFNFDFNRLRVNAASATAGNYQVVYKAGSYDGAASDSPNLVQLIHVGADANDAPTCDEGSQTVYNGGRSNQLYTPCQDVDDDALTLFTVTGEGPSHGTLTLGGDGDWRYVPTTGYVGEDTFSMYATDPSNAVSNTVLYTLNVQTPVAPACSNVPQVEVRPGLSKSIFLDCTYPQFDPRTFSVVSAGDAAKGALTGGGFGSNFTYTAAANAVEGAIDTFSMKANNVVGDSNVATGSAKITRFANEAPSCFGSFPLAVAKSGTTVLNLAQFCNDPEDDPLTFAIDSPPNRGTATANPNGTISFLGDGTNFSTTMTVHATDVPPEASTKKNSFSFQVTINQVDSLKPTCTAVPNLVVRPAASISVSPTCSDPGSATITSYTSSNVLGGTVTPSGSSPSGTRQFTATGAHGTTGSFSWTATSANGTSDPITQNIAISNTANRAPECYPNGTGAFAINVYKAATPQTVNLEDLCFDDDGDDLRYTVVSPMPAGQGSVTGGTNNPTITYTGTGSYVGPTSFTVFAQDVPPVTATPKTSSTITVSLNVLNSAQPSCNTQPTVSLRTGGQRGVSTPFCTSPDGSPITYSVKPASGPLRGGLTTPVSGYRVYTNDGTAGPDSFTWLAQNAAGTTEVVQPFAVSASYNEAPTCFTFTSVGSPQALPKSGASAVGVDCNDPDGDQVTVTRLSQPTPSIGTITPDSYTEGPNASFTFTGNGTGGTASFTYKATDNWAGAGGPLSTDTQTWWINGITTTAPSCFEPAPLNVRPGQTKSLTWRCDAPSGPITFKITQAPTGGQLTPPGDSTPPFFGGSAFDSRSYTANADPTTATDTVKFIGSNAVGDSVVMTQTINIFPAANSTPLCGSVGISAKVGTPRTLALPCSDADNDAMTAVELTQPAAGKGTVSTQNGSLTYTAGAAMQPGDTASFTFRADDARGGVSSPATTVTVTIVSNTVPHCNPIPVTFEVAVGGEIQFPAPTNCSDSDGDALTYLVDKTGLRGQLSDPGVGGGRTYTAPATTGADSFKLYANDGTVDSNQVPVNINVVSANPNNQPPVCNPQTVSTPHNAVKGITVTCTDPEGQSLGYGYAPGSVLTSTCGTFSAVNVSTGALTFTPAGGKTCQATITYGAQDNLGAQTGALLTVNVTNAAPVCSAVSGTVGAIEATAIDIPVTCTDAEGDPRTLVVTQPPSNGTVTPGDAKFTYASGAGFSGDVTFKFRAEDGITPVVQSNEITVTVNVTTKVVCPAFAATEVLNHRAKSLAAPGCTDADAKPNAALAYSISDQPDNGAATINPATGVVQYTPTGDYAGPDALEISATDGRHVRTVAVPITVLANDAPSCAAIGTVTTIHDRAKPTVLSCPADDEGDTVTLSTQTAPMTGASLAYDQATRTVTYTPKPGHVGADAFTVRASDGHGGTQDLPVTVSVTNVVPVCQDVTDSAKNHTPEPVALSCTDGDGDTLTYTPADPPNGAVSGAGASRTYTPDGDFAGVDSFGYTASDGVSSSVSKTVTVTVAANAAPVCQPIAAITTLHDTAASRTLTCAADAEGDAVSLATQVAPMAGAALAYDQALRKVTYTPKAGYAGSDGFTVRVSDGHGGTQDLTATVTVTNAAPTCTDTSAVVANHTAKPVPLACSDPDGDVLAYSAGSAAHGTLSGSGSSRTYTPTGDYAGPDSFTFSVTDGIVGSGDATATVTVAANTPPACTTASADVAHNTAKTIALGCTDAEGDAILLSTVTAPAHGAVTYAGGSATYTPTTGYAGADSFVVKAADGHGGETSRTVALTVAAAPVVTPVPPKPTPTVTPPLTPQQMAIIRIAQVINKLIAKGTYPVSISKLQLVLEKLTGADCPTECRAAILVVLSGKAKTANASATTLGKATVKVPAGGGPLKLKLNAKAKALLKKNKKLKVKVTITLTDSKTGAKSTKAKVVTLKAGK